MLHFTESTWPVVGVEALEAFPHFTEVLGGTDVTARLIEQDMTSRERGCDDSF